MSEAVTATDSIVQEIKADAPEFEEFITVIANAYPINKMYNEEARQRFRQRMLDFETQEPRVRLYALYRAGRVLGGMRLYDFEMKLHRANIPVGGVGMVAVDLQHKKEKVARDLISSYLRHYRGRGFSLAALYPFRPDFYKKMGFGYGTKINQYRVKPENLPVGGERSKVRFMEKGERDEAALLACYNGYREQTSGLFDKKPFEIRRLFDNAENKIIGYFEPEAGGGAGDLKAYLVFNFKQPNPEGNFMLTNLVCSELTYESPEALRGLLSFLRSQADQINEIIFNLQDENFHLLLADPRNGSGEMMPHVYHASNLQGVGIMYRVLDVPGIFNQMASHDFGGQTCKLKLTVADSFLPENAGSYAVHFSRGRVTTAPPESESEVELSLEVADFSSLLVGATDLKTLARLGLAGLSDPAYLDRLNRIFAADQKPLCFTAF